MYSNPVIRGFNPDPSITKKDGTFYLVTSTFEYFPGATIYESRDLVNWKYASSALNRENLSRLKGCKNSVGGIYAVTIRYFDGTFYVVTTNKGLNSNFLVYSSSIHGPWNGPIEIRKGGIDPSLFFDDDKSCFYTSNGVVDGKRGIIGFYIDPKTGERLSEERLLTEGITGHATEAPHIFKRGDYYYLIFSEGGTGFGHHEEVMRSKSLLGPWEYRGKSILSHVDRKDHIIQATGHADIIEYESGKWCAVFLGIRKFFKQGLHNLGRETFLSKVEWIDDWPVIGKGGTIEIINDGFDSNQNSDKRVFISFKKELDSYPLLKVRVPNNENYIQRKEEGSVTLRAKDRLNRPLGEPTMLLYRQSEPFQSFKATLDLKSIKGNAGIGVWQTNDYYYRIKARVSKEGKATLSSSLCVHGFERTLKSVTLPERGDSDITLEIRAEGEWYYFYADGIALGKASYAGVATEAMMYMTFTGALFFIYSEGGEATFRDGLLIETTKEVKEPIL